MAGRKMIKRLKLAIKRFFRALDPSYCAVLEAEERIAALTEQNQWLFWMQRLREGESFSDCQRRFWRSFPKAEGDVRLIQLGTGYLLENMKRLCDECGVRFFLQEGTLLGAVRHGGYIPWDDDVDVGMLRGDLDRLRAYIRDDETFEITDYYDFLPNCKMAKFRTRSEELTCFIDIFIYDLFDGEDPKACWERVTAARERFCDDLAAHRRAFSKAYVDAPMDDEKDRALIERLYDVRRRELGVGRESGNIVYWAVENNRVSPLTRAYRRDDFFPLREAAFEGRSYWIPANAEQILRERYGNYLLIPPDVMRQRHMEKYDIPGLRRFIRAHGLDRDGLTPEAAGEPERQRRETGGSQ